MGMSLNKDMKIKAIDDKTTNKIKDIFQKIKNKSTKINEETTI